MTSVSPKAIRVGWAARDITPPRPCMLQGQFYVRISEGVADPLTVTALALDGGAGPDSHAILVSCDLTGVGSPLHEAARAELKKRLPDFDPLKFFMNATHTHTAPVTGRHWYPSQPPDVMSPEECAALVAERVAAAAAEAWEKRAPGGVSWAHTHAVVGHNRRVVYRDGTVKMYGKTADPLFECIEGCEDHGVGLLCTYDGKGALTGMAVNLACPSQVSEHEMKVSADFWHEVRTDIRARLGQGLFILPQCAPAGDQSPRWLVNRNIEQVMWERRGLSQRQDIGRRVAEAVAGIVPTAGKDIAREVVVRHSVEMVDLPVRMVTKAERDEAEAAIARFEADPKSDPKVRHSWLLWHRRVIARFEEQEKNPFLPVELHVLRVGDVAFATAPFEYYLDYGHRIRGRSPAVQTLCIQLAAGSEGYLPTERAVRGASYGAQAASSKVGPEGGQVIVEHCLRKIAEFWG